MTMLMLMPIVGPCILLPMMLFPSACASFIANISGQLGIPVYWNAPLSPIPAALLSGPFAALVLAFCF